MKVKSYDLTPDQVLGYQRLLPAEREIFLFPWLEEGMEFGVALHSAMYRCGWKVWG
jgi:hypothetical protein